MSSPKALAARAIRTELRNVFPGVKFSVTMTRGSQKLPLDVAWLQGPTVEEVEKVAEKTVPQRDFFNLHRL